MRHVDEWLDSPSFSDEEKKAKEWIELFRLPACRKMSKSIKSKLNKIRLTVEQGGKRWECSGASAMGDVWIRRYGSKNAYDKRVDISELSNWRVYKNTTK